MSKVEGVGRGGCGAVMVALEDCVGWADWVCCCWVLVKEVVAKLACGVCFGVPFGVLPFGLPFGVPEADG